MAMMFFIFRLPKIISYSRQVLTVLSSQHIQKVRGAALLPELQTEVYVTVRMAAMAVEVGLTMVLLVQNLH